MIKLKIEKALEKMGCKCLMNGAWYQKWYLDNVIVYLQFPEKNFVVTKNKTRFDNYPEFTGSLSDTEGLEKAILKAFNE